MITKEELVRASVTWKQAHFSAVMSRSLQLPCKCTKVDGGAMKGVTPSMAPNPTAPKEFCLDDVHGHVVPYGGSSFLQLGPSILLDTNTSEDTTCGSICFSSDCEAPTTYGELYPGSSRVPICLRNLSAHPFVILTKVVVVKVTLANQVPLVVLQMGTSGDSTCGPQKTGSWGN